MGDISTKTVAKKFDCLKSEDCASDAEKYVNEEPKKFFDSYSCSATPVMNGKGGYSEYLQALLVLCTGTPKAPLPVKK